MTGTILVVEDQDTARESLCELLAAEGYQVEQAADGAAGIGLVDKTDFDIVLTDLTLPGQDGIAVLKHAREVAPQTFVMIMTAYGSLDSAIEAMRLGAEDYILKPLIIDEVLHKAHRLMEHRSLAWEIQMLRTEVSKHFSPTEPVGRSPAMQEIMNLIEKVGPAPSTVLISGESGVGKEVVARAIHEQSPRRSNVFLPVNCSAIPETLLESQLFGYVKGAFTGATSSQEGLFQHAGGGTIFLDELGDMPLSLQPKLLRSIEEKEVLPVGATTPVQVDVRILAATNRDLEKEVEAGRFREDLYYRLNVIDLHIPPLRERQEDIPPLIEHLIHRHNVEMKTNYKGADNAAMKILMSVPWKGNVRELQNVLERAMILGNREWITPLDLPESKVPKDDPPPSIGRSLKAAVSAYEKSHIENVLRET